MRLAPLIPLAILGIGSLVIEGIHLESIAQSPTDTLLKIQDALVVSTDKQGTAEFTATQLEIGLTSSSADEVRGEYATAAITQRFEAAHLQHNRDTGVLVLRDNVELWHGDSYLQTNLATIHRNGSITGHSVRITNKQGEAQADNFALDRSNDIRLEGNVYMKLRQ